jgi:hypothetical protein
VADSSKQDGKPGRVSVWTFLIRGGEPFDLKIKNNLSPALNHDGRMTLWKMVGTDDEAASVEAWVKGPLIGARVERHTEVEDAEMLAIRNERLGRES